MKQNKRILRAPQERAFKDVGVFATTPFIYKGTATLGEYLVDHYKTPSVERLVKAEGTFHVRRFFTLQIRRLLDSSTGTTVALQYGEKSTILCSRGANDGLDPSWIKEEWFQRADHLYLSGYSFLSPAQLPTVRKAMRIAQGEGMSVSVSPPPANLINSSGGLTSLRRSPRSTSSS